MIEVDPEIYNKLRAKTPKGNAKTPLRQEGNPYASKGVNTPKANKSMVLGNTNGSFVASKKSSANVPKLNNANPALPQKVVPQSARNNTKKAPDVLQVQLSRQSSGSVQSNQQKDSSSTTKRSSQDSSQYNGGSFGGANPQ